MAKYPIIDIGCIIQRAFLLIPILGIQVLVGLNFVDAQIRAMNVISTATQQDIIDLKDNLNSDVRYSLTFGEFADTATKEEYMTQLNAVLDKFDNEILPLFANTSKKIVLSLANPPGGFFTRSDPLPKMRIFQEAWAQEAMIEVWDLLSKRYASNTAIAAYHLQNEPAIGNGPASGLMNWYDLQSSLIQKIRENDLTHPISVAADYSSPTKLNKIKIPANAGIIWYSFNFYQPTKFLRQGVEIPAYKTCFAGGEPGRIQLEKALEKAIKFGRGKKLFVTEFTTSRFAPKGCGLKYLKSILKIFEKRKWSWAYHAWREADAWSLELTSLEDKSGQLTERAKLLKSHFSR